MKLSMNRMNASLAAALLFATATVSARAESAKSEYVETIDQTFPLAANGSFTLGNKNGSIELNAWDKNEIRVVADKRMRLDGGGWWIARLIGLKSNSVETDADARALFAKLSVEFSGDEKARTVTTHYPDTSGVNCQVAYHIYAPKDAKISLRTVNGAVQARGLSGGANVETTSGSVTLEDIRGPIHAETTNGRVQLERVSGAITAEATNGSVSARLLADAKLEDVDMRSVNGKVAIYVPAASGFRINARTVNGSVSCDLPLASVTEQSRRRLEAVVGTPGVDVRLTTTNGSVQIGLAS